MHFGTGKSRDVLCRACRAARRDTLVTTSATGATRATRVQGRRHSVDWVDMSTSLVSRSCSCDWCKSRAQKPKLVYGSTTASSSSAMFMLKQARHDTHDKRDTLVTTRVTRACRVVPWHNKRNLGYIRRSFLARSSELCEPWIYIKCIATT